MEKEKVTIEEAVDRAGYGLYSYISIWLAGACIMAFASIGYGSTVLIPSSACELETTVAQQGLLATAPIVGSILGSPLWGYLADIKGRRTTLFISLVGGAVINCIGSLSVNWVMLMVIQFIASIMVAGLFPVSMTLLSECVPMAKRNRVVLLVTSIFMLSQGLMTVLAIPIVPLKFSIYLPALGIYWNSWRTLMLVYAAPGFLAALWVFFMQESPKFVFTKGDEEKTLAILRTIHKVNHLRSKSEYQVTGIIKEEVKFASDGSVKKQSQILPLFKAPLLKFTIIMTLLFVFQQIKSFLIWMPTIANRLVQTLQSGESIDQPICSIITSTIDISIDEDATPCALDAISLLMVMAVGVLQSIVNLTFTLFIDKTGRRNLVIGVALVCGVSGLLVNVVPNAIGSVILFMIMVHGMLTHGLYTAISVALFPTSLRSTAIAIPMMGGRVASVVSVNILNSLLVSNCELGFYLFSALFASSAIIAAFLPDDRLLAKNPPPELSEPQEDVKTVTEL